MIAPMQCFCLFCTILHGVGRQNNKQFHVHFKIAAESVSFKSIGLYKSRICLFALKKVPLVNWGR